MAKKAVRMNSNGLKRNVRAVLSRLSISLGLTKEKVTMCTKAPNQCVCFDSQLSLGKENLAMSFVILPINVAKIKVSG